MNNPSVTTRDVQSSGWGEFQGQKLASLLLSLHIEIIIPLRSPRSCAVLSLGKADIAVVCDAIRDCGLRKDFIALDLPLKETPNLVSFCDEGVSLVGGKTWFDNPDDTRVVSEPVRDALAVRGGDHGCC